MPPQLNQVSSITTQSVGEKIVLPKSKLGKISFWIIIISILLLIASSRIQVYMFSLSLADVGNQDLQSKAWLSLYVSQVAVLISSIVAIIIGFRARLKYKLGLTQKSNLATVAIVLGFPLTFLLGFYFMAILFLTLMMRGG